MGDQQVKVMRLRYGATCACGTEVAKGERAGYDSTFRNVLCLRCLDIRREADATPAPATLTPIVVVDVDVDVDVLTMPSDEVSLATGPVDIGAPGASLDREYQRRKDAREARIRASHPRIGGLALTDQPQSTTAFATGATGEQRLAARLEKDCGDQVLFLHNRKLGGNRRDGDIDHIAIAPSGVYVIDAKHYPGATVEVRSTGGWVSKRVETLHVAGRDRTSLLTGLNKQRLAVTAVMAQNGNEPAIEIIALLCFVDAKLPLFTTLRIDDVPILSPRATSKLLRRPGPLDQQTREHLHQHLAARLPTA